MADFDNQIGRRSRGRQVQQPVRVQVLLLSCRKQPE
jgi:hypothetical protein